MLATLIKSFLAILQIELNTTPSGWLECTLIEELISSSYNTENIRKVT